MNHDDTSEVMYEYTGRRAPRNVTHIRFHPSVTKIGKEGAFANRTELREVILNKGLKKIEAFTFIKCSALEQITIPSSVLEINQQAFYRCSSLREIVISDGLKKIGGHVFQECKSLERITIPSTVDEIGSNAFTYCTNLQEVVLKEGIKRIELNAFWKCKALRSITIPSTINEIGYGAYEDCSSLREVTIANNEVQVKGNAFINCISLRRFKFPDLSTRLNNIIQAGQSDVEAKIDDITAVEWRDGELVIPSVRNKEIQNTSGRVETVVEVDKEKLDKVIRLIRHYEIKEAATLFELALWKAKISQVVLDYIEPANRDACRIEVPGPIKDAIMQYL